jgi:hypothetical protein
MEDISFIRDGMGDFLNIATLVLVPIALEDLSGPTSFIDWLNFLPQPLTSSNATVLQLQPFKAQSWSKATFKEMARSLARLILKYP